MPRLPPNRASERTPIARRRRAGIARAGHAQSTSGSLATLDHVATNVLELACPSCFRPARRHRFQPPTTIGSWKLELGVLLLNPRRQRGVLWRVGDRGRGDAHDG